MACRVTPACAAKVIGQLPRELRNALMRRMLAVKPVTEPALRILENTLHEDLLLAIGGDRSNEAPAEAAE